MIKAKDATKKQKKKTVQEVEKELIRYKKYTDIRWPSKTPKSPYQPITISKIRKFNGVKKV